MMPAFAHHESLISMPRPALLPIDSCRFVGSYFTPGHRPRDRRPQIAFAGRSNVGKSTLLNCLIGRKRMAKVSSTPGKTRSLNFFLINDRFFLVDLPGYGYAKVSKDTRHGWRRLIEDYLTTSARLIGLVLLVDCRRELTDDDLILVRWLSQRELPVLSVVTKTDKLGRDKVQRKIAQVERELGFEAVAFSAVTGAGKKELLSAIRSLLSDHYSQSKV